MLTTTATILAQAEKVMRVVLFQFSKQEASLTDVTQLQYDAELYEELWPSFGGGLQIGQTVPYLKQLRAEPLNIGVEFHFTSHCSNW